MKIYIASGNKGKIEEVLLVFPNSKVIPQNAFCKFVEPEETGKTFKENAIIKAKALYDFLKENIVEFDFVLADDSGILVPALGAERLGVYTKRQMLAWTKETGKTEREFWNNIVTEVGEGEEAEFCATVAVITSSGEEIIFDEVVDGTLTFAKGNNGFGFDPIFKVNEKTFAEYSIEEKQKMNPRAKALKHIKNIFNK